MGAPTFVTSAQSVYNSATSPKTASVTTQTGDRLVVCAVGEQNTVTLDTPTGGSLTYTLQQDVAVTDFCHVSVWTATATANTTFNVSVTGSGGDFGITVLQFRGSDGLGATAKTNNTGAPSLALTATGVNSAVVAVVGDWNATDGATRTWRTINAITPTAGNGGERTYVLVADHYTIYAAYWSDVDGTGSKTTGLSAPTGQKYSIVAVEVLGSAGTQTVSPSGIASTEAFGTPTVTPGAITVAPTGIASGEQLGAPTVTLGQVTVQPAGVPSAEAFGTPTVAGGAATIAPTGIPSAEAFGAPTVSPGPVTIAPSGIGSGEALGTPTVAPGPVVVTPAAIASAEAFGTPVVTVPGGATTIQPTGIPSGEAVGTPTVLANGSDDLDIDVGEPISAWTLHPALSTWDLGEVESGWSVGPASSTWGVGPAESGWTLGPART